MVRTDENGNEVFFVDGKPDRSCIYDINGDCALSDNGYITVTPIRMICNDAEVISAMQSAEFCL